jgi:cytochrome c oxidase cbb3-type subunit 3
MRILLWFGIAGVVCAQTNPFAGDSAAIDVGKGNFRLYCAPCHGIHAQGGRGPDLTRGTFASGDSDAELYRVIAHGVEGTEMTSYEGRFDDPMIWRFVSFIRSVTKTGTGRAPGDAAHGRELFQGKGGCAGCHAAGATGGGIGPGLGRVGRQRSLEYLREKLVNPSASLSPGYSTITVKLRDGREVRGVEKGFDDFSAQLLDAKGQYHSYRREEVASMKREERSIMPTAAAQKLSASEQTDLVAYLASLRGGK